MRSAKVKPSTTPAEIFAPNSVLEPVLFHKYGIIFANHNCKDNKKHRSKAGIDVESPKETTD